MTTLAAQRITDMDSHPNRPTSAAQVAARKAAQTKRRIKSGERAERIRKTQEALLRYAFDYDEAKRNGTQLPNMKDYGVL